VEKLLSLLEAASLAAGRASGSSREPRIKWNYLELVADPSAIYESTPRLRGLSCTIAAPALSMRARRDFVRMVRLCSVSHPGVFVVGCRSVRADAARSVGGRAAFGGICLLCSQEKKQGDH
jgi:hypothetical protein